MQCEICASQIGLFKPYDNHLGQLNVRQKLKKILQLIDFLIPSQLRKLKRISSFKSPFKGDVGVCGCCGHGAMQTPPTVEQLKQYYSSFYWSRSSRTSAVKNVVVQQDVHLRDPRALHQIDFVWPAIGSKPLQNVLEIGAGSASSLLLLKHKCGEPAPALHVCEPGSQWEDHYRQHRVARIADYFPFETAVSFDYIHTSHWLEHVSKLGETVGHLRDMLKPGGYVFVEVPNTEHDYWTQAINDVPHIHFFTPRSLQRAFEVQGLKCLKLEEAGITFNDHCKGIKPTAEDFGPREKGFWIRALFIKESQQS